MSIDQGYTDRLNHRAPRLLEVLKRLSAILDFGSPLESGAPMTFDDPSEINAIMEAAEQIIDEIERPGQTALDYKTPLIDVLRVNPRSIDDPAIQRALLAELISHDAVKAAVLNLEDRAVDIVLFMCDIIADSDTTTSQVRDIVAIYDAIAGRNRRKGDRQ